MFHVKFDTDNAAFADGDCIHEIARILRDVTSRLEAGNPEGSIYDSNGNKVGEYRLQGSRR